MTATVACAYARIRACFGAPSRVPSNVGQRDGGLQGVQRVTASDDRFDDCASTPPRHIRSLRRSNPREPVRRKLIGDNIIRNRQFDLDVENDGTMHSISAYGPANTGSGTIRGVEFSYSQFYDMLPGALSGLGLQFNYTYIDQDGLEDPNGAVAPDTRFNSAGEQVLDERNTFRVFSGLPLQGYSDENLNIVGMYEYEDISFRLAYTWRSEYLLTLRESEDFSPVYAKASGMMDASLYYAINDNWKIGIEGSNLLNTETQTVYQMDQDGVRTDGLSFTTDRRYALSVRAVF